MTGKKGLAVCKDGVAGCFYYEGAAAGRTACPERQHLCSCNTPYGFDGYHCHDLVIEELKKCPLGKW